jgi:hypothetical protein
MVTVEVLEPDGAISGRRVSGFMRKSGDEVFSNDVIFLGTGNFPLGRNEPCG